MQRKGNTKMNSNSNNNATAKPAAPQIRVRTNVKAGRGKFA